MQSTQSPLTPLSKFKQSGRCPVEPYHLIFNEGPAMEAYGAIIKFGSRWLVDEGLFFSCLRERRS